MLWSDLKDIQQFHKTPAGKMAKTIIATAIRGFLASIVGKEIAVMGCVIPYLYRINYNKYQRFVAMMTPDQGIEPVIILQNPSDSTSRKNHATLVYEDNLPFDNQIFDAMILIHLLEYSKHQRRLLTECWRVLKEGGRILIVVPARRGFWSRSDATPFGYGNPFSQEQLFKLLMSERFEPIQITRALYFPPTNNVILQSIAIWMEKYLKMLVPRLGGVLIIEAEKKIYMPLLQDSKGFNPKFIGQNFGHYNPNPVANLIKENHDLKF